MSRAKFRETHTLQRPDASFKEIIKAVQDEYMNSTSALVHRIDIVDELILGAGFVYIINCTGSIKIIDEHNYLISIIQPPLVAGIGCELAYDSKLLTMKFQPGMHVYQITADAFRNLVSRQNLWEHVAQIVSYYLKGMIRARERTTSRCSLEIVKMLITEYIALPHKAREEMGVCEFIASRSLLSRSHVMGILAQMKRHGDINIIRGKLLSTNFDDVRFK